MTTSKMTNTTNDKEVMNAVKTALKEIVRPWEILCGLTDIGNAYVPDIYCKSLEDYTKHEGDYMDADTPLIDKSSGEAFYKMWNDENVNEAIREALEKGNYIKIQNKPKYAQE